MRIRYESILPLYWMLWKRWREARFQRFRGLIADGRIGCLLDVGGVARDWFGRGEVVGEVHALNLVASELTEVPSGSPLIRCLAGDGRRLDFADQSYEVVYSNSVIEHVGGLEDQAAFAREIRRVGKKIWVQTPAFECPVEPHYLGLFVHWLPQSWQWPLIRWTTFIGLSGAATTEGLRNIMKTTRLLRKKEFASLFPDCEIWVERLLWVFPKSYIAYRK